MEINIRKVRLKMFIKILRHFTALKKKKKLGKNFCLQN